MLRILLLAIVSSGTSITLLGQDEVIRYYEVNNVLGHNEINLYSDNTFALHNRGSSCWTWNSFYGNWKAENGKLILTNTIEQEDENLIIDSSAVNSDSFFITVKNDKGFFLEGVEVTLILNENKRSIALETDMNGEIKFPKTVVDTQRIKRLDNVRFNTVIKFSNKRRFLNFESQVFNVHYNKISVTIIDFPDTQQHTNTITYKIKYPYLFLESQAQQGKTNSWGSNRETYKTASKQKFLINSYFVDRQYNW